MEILLGPAHFHEEVHTIVGFESDVGKSGTLRRVRKGFGREIMSTLKNLFSEFLCH